MYFILHVIELKPPMGAAQNWVRRNINQANLGRGGRNQGQGGYGRGGCGGHGMGCSGWGAQRIWSDSRMITLTDRSQVEYHPSFSFPQHVYLKFKPEDKENLWRKHAAYNAQKSRSWNLRLTDKAPCKPPHQTIYPSCNTAKPVRWRLVSQSWAEAMSKHRINRIKGFQL